jgi:malate dehydrogenase
MPSSPRSLTWRHAPEDVVADIIVFVAGVQPSRDGTTRMTMRDQLARANVALFREYAKSIAKQSNGHEIVLLVTNPVELGVEVFAQELGRHRVIGIGAYSDTLRFRREIAKDIGVRRQLVRGFTLGEHGDGIMPAWSTVSVHGWDRAELELRMPLVGDGRPGASYDERLNGERDVMMALLAKGEVVAAFDHVSTLEPDLRVALKPYVTLLSGARTSFATAGVVVDLVRTLLDGREVVVAGQVQLNGEFLGLSGPLGVPISVGGAGGLRVLEVPLSANERDRLIAVSQRLNSKIKGWLSDV